MKKNFKNKRRLSISKPALGMLSVINDAYYCLNNGEINLDSSLIECDNLSFYQKIILNASLYGLDTRYKGNETLIWGGIDYVDNIKYKNILFTDKKLAKEHTIKIRKERVNTSNDKLVYISKSLNESEFDYIIDDKISMLIYSEFNGYNR